MQRFDVDVCVIGAGIAGLCAADQLAGAGLSVVVLEARERIGGRILTRFAQGHPDLPVELGAEFIHGKHPDLHRLSREAGLPLSEVAGLNYRYADGQLRRMSEDQDDTAGDLLSSPDLARADIDFSSYIANTGVSPEAKAWTTSYVEGFNGASADRIGTQALRWQQCAETAIEGDRSWRIENGYGALVRLFGQRVAPVANILLNTVARKLDWSKGLVCVTANSAQGAVTVNAKAAIVTAPVGVLRGTHEASRIQFSPEPAVLLDMALLEPGAALRVNLVFSEPVWRQEAPHAGFVLSNLERFPTWWTRESASAYLMTGWNGGPKAAALAGLAGDQLLDAALQSLSKVLNRSESHLREKLESWHYHDWQTDPFCAGSYSYVAAGGFAFSQRVADPVDDTLWFAGEAMARDGFWGTVHGAIGSARRAASQILYSKLKINYASTDK